MEIIEACHHVDGNHIDLSLNFKSLNPLLGFHSFSNETLDNLSVFSESIDVPLVYGEFNSEQHYLDTLKLVLDSTQETSNRVSFFCKHILPSICHKKRLLDIGPGDGHLTKNIAGSFEHITAVDLNQYILNGLGKYLPDNIDFLKIPFSIEEADFKNEFYDLAVLSHILYYVKTSEWINVVNKVYKSLRNGGRLAIALGGDELDKADLISHFGGQKLQVNDLAKHCQNIFGCNNISLFSSDEAFYARSKHAMLQIASFMLKDVDITACKDDLIQYIETHFKKGESHYEMTTRQKYIVIDKSELNGQRYVA